MGRCEGDGMHRHEDWNLSIRGRDVTVRVVCAIGWAGGVNCQGTVVGFHVLYGPSRLGLDIAVTSKEDAASKIEGLLPELMGKDRY